MKKLLYIVVACMLVACNQAYKSEVPANEDLSEMDKVGEATEVETKVILNYKVLAEQKLNDYADLLRLQQQHPEFEEEIAKQLMQLSKDSIIPFSETKKIVISELQQIGEVQDISDSVQQVTFSIQVETDTSVLRDTLNAIFTTRQVQLDDTEHTTVKVSFEKQ